MTATVGRYGGLAVGLAALVVTARPPDRATAQSRLWRPEERVLLTDFSHTDALAASPFTVFAATPHGLSLYDRRARAWRLPVTALDGYPPARARVALADAAGNAVWLGTDDGWARYDVDVGRWERASVAGGVSDLVLDADDPASGIFMFTRSGWQFVPRGTSMLVQGRGLPRPDRRLEPLEPRAALTRAPQADALRALILADPRHGIRRFTSAARTPDQHDLFLGTDGLGVVRVDVATGEWERLPFGLLAQGAGAVAAGPGGIWVATFVRVGQGERRGLTWVTADLSSFTAVAGSGVAGFGFREGRRLLVSGSYLWLATEAGLLKIERESLRTRVFDLNVLSLAPAPDGIWAGTTRGLAAVTHDDRVIYIGSPGAATSGLAAQPVLSLLAVGETLWVGSRAGLGVLVPGAPDAVVPPEVADAPALRQPVVALARRADTLFVATSEQLAWRDPVSGRWTVARPRADLGRLTALAGDVGGDGVWIGGTGGLAFWRPARSTFLTLRVPGDVPAPVRDLALDPQYIWVATDSGVVRFARAAVLGP